MAERGSARTTRVKSSSPEVGSLPENPPCPESSPPGSLEIIENWLAQKVLQDRLKKNRFWAHAQASAAN